MSFRIRKLSESKPKRSLPWRTGLVSSIAVARPLLGWYSCWKKRHKKARRVHVLKRVLVILISVFIVLLLLAGVGKALVTMRILTLSSLTSLSGSPPPADENGFINILLIGQGDSEHDGKDLTDTIMVASMDPEDTKSVVLLSLPRDLYFLKTEKMGKGKLNSYYRDYKGYLKYTEGMETTAASKEAIRELADEIARKIGLTMHGAVKVDFVAFTEAVNAVGGVDIEVPYDIIDEEYPDDNFGYDPFTILKGPQHLDGATALKYARSRSTTSDFDRSQRQQQLLKALSRQAKEKELHKDPTTIIEFLRIFSEHVETTFSMREIIGLVDLARQIDPQRVVAMQLNDRNALYDSFIEPGGLLYTPPRNLFDGFSVLLPVSIPEFPVTWKQIKTLKTLFFDTRSVYIANPTLSVLNAGAKSGAARRLATELTRYGFSVDVIANASLPEQDTSFVTTMSGEDENLGLFFASLLNVNTAVPPEPLPTDELRQITIVLGQDYTYLPLQNLLTLEE